MFLVATHSLWYVVNLKCRDSTNGGCIYEHSACSACYLDQVNNYNGLNHRGTRVTLRSSFENCFFLREGESRKSRRGTYLIRCDPESGNRTRAEEAECDRLRHQAVERI